MNYFGVYHSDYSRRGIGVCDAPCITKGRMTLCADGAAEYLGEISDVPSFLQTVRYFVFPSYREGTPRATLEAIGAANKRINRALAAAAAAIGAQAHIKDAPGYTPLVNDPIMTEAALEAGRLVFGDDTIAQTGYWSTGCTDMGDLSAVMPAVHPYVSGAQGVGHGADYRIADPVKACVRSAAVQVVTAAKLLENDAALAKSVLANAKPRFSSHQAYFEAMDAFFLDRDVVSYEENGDVTLKLGQ